MTGAALSVIVSTIGRPADLRRLIESLVVQDRRDQLELIVVDQSDDGSCIALLSELELPFDCRWTTSARGVSLGRNAGAALASGWLFTFPDDNCWYAPDTVSTVLDLVRERGAPDVISGIQVTEDGQPSMLRWPDSARPITRRNVQLTAIESTIFCKRSLFERLSGFDETMGVGSPGPFQAGEGTDLLLRAIDAGASVSYEPAVRVIQTDPRRTDTSGFDKKMAGYGRGIGHLYRIHHLPKSEMAYLMARKVAAAVVRTARGRRDLARADLAWARGLAAGYRIRPPS
jgi:glycosyltransferase involved in cell wall biosynthesis